MHQHLFPIPITIIIILILYIINNIYTIIIIVIIIDEVVSYHNSMETSYHLGQLNIYIMYKLINIT